MTLVILTGRSATGKTALADALARKLEAVIFTSDNIRQEIFKKHEFPESEREKIVPAVYNEMFERAEKALAQGKNVILDATFYSKDLRERAKALGKDSFLILVRCSAEKRKERQFRAGLPEEVYEEPDNADVIVDTESAPPEECAEQVLAAMKK